MKIASAGPESRPYDLSIFHDVTKALKESLDLDIIMETLMQKMAAYFEPASWALLMLDETTGEPRYASPVEPEFEKLNAVRLKTDQTLAECVIETGDPIVISDLCLDARIAQDTVDP